MSVQERICKVLLEAERSMTSQEIKGTVNAPNVSVFLSCLVSEGKVDVIKTKRPWLYVLSPAGIAAQLVDQDMEQRRHFSERAKIALGECHADD